MVKFSVISVFVLGQLVLCGAPAESSDQNRKARQRLVQNYGQLPLTFEPNLGQTGAPVKFLARGRGYTLYLTATEAVMQLKSPKAHDASLGKLDILKPGELPAGPEKSGASVRLSLLGSNASASVTGSEELPGKSNYLIGNDPAKWRTNVPTYGKVVYQGVYPGI